MTRTESRGRRDQPAYSETMAKMLDETGRRNKARKIISVLEHALGRTDLTGLVALDVGCSAGFIADELAESGAKTVGIDIDEPGLARAHKKFGSRIDFTLAHGERIPLADDSVDVIVFNHIYEHVVDPVAVVGEIFRVLRPSGILYLGLGHKWQIVEPHYRLPFLSWLPQTAADRYLQMTGKGDSYYERYLSRQELRRLFAAFDAWDYTLPVVAEPRRFSGGDVIPQWTSLIPKWALRASMPLVPTYLWVAFKSPAEPSGPALRIAPSRVNSLTPGYPGSLPGI